MSNWNKKYKELLWLAWTTGSREPDSWEGVAGGLSEAGGVGGLTELRGQDSWAEPCRRGNKTEKQLWKSSQTVLVSLAKC
jgi:hypothetical protein